MLSSTTEVEIPGGAERAEAEKGETCERPKVVYLHPPLELGSLLGREGERWRVRLRNKEQLLEAAEDVDPALLEEVIVRGGRVMLESASAGIECCIVGVLQTQRALEINSDGDVIANIRSLRLAASDELQLKTRNAMLWVQSKDVELYGRNIVTRARETAKILARAIALN